MLKWSLVPCQLKSWRKDKEEIDDQGGGRGARQGGAEDQDGEGAGYDGRGGGDDHGLTLHTTRDGRQFIENFAGLR